MTTSKHSLEHQIKAARPRLKTVSPLAHWIVIALAAFNIVFGLSLFTAFDANRYSAPLLIVNNIFTYQFWGLVFMGLGVLKIYSVYTNNWTLARNSLIGGVSVKAAWAIALTVRSFVSPGTLLVNFMWITLALIQMGTYIYFMPPAVERYKQRREDR